MVTRRQAADWWSKIAPDYDDAYTSPTDLLENRIVAATVRAALTAAHRRVDADPNLWRRRRPILDVGCGTGWITQWLDDRDLLAYEGVDFSPGMITEAKRRHPRAAFRVVPDGADWLRILPDNSHLGILALFGVLSLVPDPSDLLRQMARVTHPAGAAVVMACGPRRPLGNNGWWEQGGTAVTMTTGAVASLARAAGWGTVTTRSLTYWHARPYAAAATVQWVQDRLKLPGHHTLAVLTDPEGP